MNNLRLGNSCGIMLSVSVVLMTSLISELRADTTYGPLRSGETLSSIVNQNYLVSPFEDAVIMQEIFRMNPQAFIGNNIGLIRQGVTLTLPSDATLRRSQPERGNTRRGQASQANEITQSLEKTLTQVRNERDQANLRLRRVEATSTAQLEVLNTKIGQLETDKQRITEQLSASSVELDGLKNSLKSLKQGGQSSVAPQEGQGIPKQLEASKALVAQQQQQIETLTLSVSDLRASSEALKQSHQAALDELQTSNQALEEKLDAQLRIASDSADSATQLEDRIETLSRQHQQQLDELKATLGAENAASSEGAADVLKIQQALELKELKAQHKQTVDDLQAVLSTQLADNEQSLVALEAEVEGLKAKSDTQLTEIAELNRANGELTSALEQANAAALPTTNSIVKAPVTNDSNSGSTKVATLTDPSPLLTTSVTKALLVEQLEKPIAFPFWGLLLGAFALGFTSLMMLFTRSRRQVVPAAVIADSASDSPLDTEASQEKLVFRAGEAGQDPDIETLRVPPRRDPSRVAILDPTMTASAVVAVTNASKNDASADQITSSIESTAVIDEEGMFESKFKLLIAEAYEELGDKGAAGALLSEVQQEGNEEQIALASSKIAQLTP